MAKPVFIGDVFGRWAFDDATAAPAFFYLYWDVYEEKGESDSLWGRVGSDGAFIGGSLFDHIDAFTTNITAFNTPTREIDDETDSVHKGRPRVSWAMA